MGRGWVALRGAPASNCHRTVLPTYQMSTMAPRAIMCIVGIGVGNFISLWECLSTPNGQCSVEHPQCCEGSWPNLMWNMYPEGFWWYLEHLILSQHPQSVSISYSRQPWLWAVSLHAVPTSDPTSPEPDAHWHASRKLPRCMELWNWELQWPGWTLNGTAGLWPSPALSTPVERRGGGGNFLSLPECPRPPPPIMGWVPKVGRSPQWW